MTAKKVLKKKKRVAANRTQKLLLLPFPRKLLSRNSFQKIFVPFWHQVLKPPQKMFDNHKVSSISCGKKIFSLSTILVFPPIKSVLDGIKVQNLVCNCAKRVLVCRYDDVCILVRFSLLSSPFCMDVSVQTNPTFSAAEHCSQSVCVSLFPFVQ